MRQSLSHLNINKKNVLSLYVFYQLHFNRRYNVLTTFQLTSSLITLTMMSLQSSATKKKCKHRSSNKESNVKSVDDYQWNPPQCDPTSTYKQPHHNSFPISIHTPNEQLQMTINETWFFKLPCKDSHVALCLYRECQNIRWPTCKARRPFYSFNKNLHRKVHEPHQLQIVSRMTLNRN